MNNHIGYLYSFGAILIEHIHLLRNYTIQGGKSIKYKVKLIKYCISSSDFLV